jgi:hypothetical protein
MKKSKIQICLVLAGVIPLALAADGVSSTSDREQKHFSLFSVVTFKNEECTSESTLTGGARKGTCYTTTECSDKSGMKSGNCASGFGVCCVFLNTAASSSAKISENRTHLRNAEYPSYATATAASTIAYTLNKMNADICQIRLDFTEFIIGGPTNTRENIPAASLTNCDRDTMKITTTEITAIASMNPGTFCGALTGEHLYIDLTRTAADAATLTITTAATATLTPAIAQRVWDIQTSQIPCYASYRAPPGCDRYFTQDYGKIISFNFYKVASSTLATTAQNTGLELASQRVNTCIRRSKGMCCVEYNVCNYYNGIVLTQGVNNGIDAGVGDEQTISEGWALDCDTSPIVIDETDTNAGMADSMCSGDYVEIPSSWTAACAGQGGGRNFVNSRYCGVRFGLNLPANEATTTHSPVCDCSEPFVVRYQTDQASDLGGGTGNAANNAGSTTASAPRGFCLDFRQTPCYF